MPASLSSDPELLTLREAAALLRYTPRSLWALVAKGTVPGVVRLPTGTKCRILLRRDALLKWIADSEMT